MKCPPLSRYIAFLPYRFRKVLLTLFGKMFGVGSIPWSPLARGLVTRPLSEQSTKRGQTDRFIQGYMKGGTSDIVARYVSSAAERLLSFS